jgi:hypothetical protein
MAAAGVPIPEATPYVWDAGHPPPSQDTLRLWTEVGNGIDKSQTGAFVFVFPRVQSFGFWGCEFFSIFAPRVSN